MDELDFTVNRSDANNPHETNPWKKYDTENEKSQAIPEDPAKPVARPEEDGKAPQAMEKRLATAEKEAAHDEKTMPSEIAAAPQNPTPINWTDA